MSIYSNLVGKDDQSPLSRQLVLSQLQKNSEPVQNVPGQKTGWAPYVAQALNSVMLAGSAKEIDNQNRAKLEKQKGLVAGLITKVKNSIANNNESGLVESMMSFSNMGLDAEKVKPIVSFIGLALKNIQANKENKIKDVKSETTRYNSLYDKYYKTNYDSLAGLVPENQRVAMAQEKTNQEMSYRNTGKNQSIPINTNQSSNMAMQATNGRDIVKEAQNWIPYIGNTDTDRIIAGMETKDPELFAEIQRQNPANQQQTQLQKEWYIPTRTNKSIMTPSEAIKTLKDQGSPKGLSAIDKYTRKIALDTLGLTEEQVASEEIDTLIGKQQYPSSWGDTFGMGKQSDFLNRQAKNYKKQDFKTAPKVSNQNELVSVIAPNGTPGKVPRANLQKALSAGFKKI